MAQCVLDWSYRNNRSALAPDFRVGSQLFRAPGCSSAALRFFKYPAADGGASWGCWNSAVDRTVRSVLKHSFV